MTLVLLGAIMGAHGIKGEVKLKSFAAVPEDIASYGPLHARDGRVFEIVKLRRASGNVICTLKNIADRDQAEAVKGVELYVDRARFPEGEVYLADYVGNTVEQEGANLGRVVGFQNFGAGELMELDTGTLIPCRFVENAGNGKLRVTLPAGFLDDA